MKTYNNNKLIESFIKGKIAELLFEMMIRDDPRHTFTIIPFGYERTTPELAQYRKLIKNYGVLTTIKQSPDFILIKNDKTEVHFVEVKYRKELNEKTALGLLEDATSVIQCWQETWFFVATQEGFYFDSGKEIVRNNGFVKKLSKEIVPQETQNKYMNVLKKFIITDKKALVVEDKNF